MERNRPEDLSGILEKFVCEIKNSPSFGVAEPCPLPRKIERAVRLVPRHFFVDQYYDTEGKIVRVNPNSPTQSDIEVIYSNLPVLTRQDPPSSTSQPSLVTNMLTELQIETQMRILEIGAGTGWNASLMGSLVGRSGRVHSIEIQADVAKTARHNVHRAGSSNVSVIQRDGWLGYPEAAPFDRIVTTVGCPDISPHWIQQLADGGIILVTLQDFPGSTWCLVLRIRKSSGGLKGKVVALAGFMGFMGQDSSYIETAKAMNKKSTIQSPIMTVPWSNWLGSSGNLFRRGDLLFFAQLEGVNVLPHAEEGTQILYQDDVSGFCLCRETVMEVFDSSQIIKVFEKVAKKWSHLGEPTRWSYSTQVLPRMSETLAVHEREAGWLLHRAHYDYLFKLRT